MKSIGTYEWAGVFADGRDPDAGGASHAYKVRLADGADVASVQYQRGARNLPDSVVGVLDEHLLMIVMDRLRAFQAGPFAHESNARALAYIEAASHALKERAAERRARGVLGRNEK